MYPGTATSKNIEPKDAKILCFKTTRGDSHSNHAAVTPATNINESATEYLIAIAVPGLNRQDFSIVIEEGVIIISARREKVKTTVIDRQEYDFTDWTRKFALPADADPLLAHARYKGGELIIRIPRGNTTENNAKATLYVY